MLARLSDLPLLFHDAPILKLWAIDRSIYISVGAFSWSADIDDVPPCCLIFKNVQRICQDGVFVETIAGDFDDQSEISRLNEYGDRVEIFILFDDEVGCKIELFGAEAFVDQTL
jgi:hypothetical protein